MRFLLLLVFATGCASISQQNSLSHSPQFKVNVLNTSGPRNVASGHESKTLLVKKCVGTDCDEEKKLEYSQFSKNLQKKILIRSLISQQVALLEQQAASLRLDRDSLKQEIYEFDRNLKMNRMSSLREVKINIERLRQTVAMEIQEIEQKISLTEKDLQVLKSNSQNSSVASNNDLSQILAILELQEAFGLSLQYKDNLIAQAIDAVVSEMI